MVLPFLIWGASTVEGTVGTIDLHWICDTNGKHIKQWPGKPNQSMSYCHTWSIDCLQGKETIRL